MAQPDTRLGGCWLTLARVVWIALVAAGLAFFVISIPVRYELLILALADRQPQSTTGFSALLFFFMVVQMLLIWLGDLSPIISALHPVNALVLLYLAHALARGRQRAIVTKTTEPVTAVAGAG